MDSNDQSQYSKLAITVLDRNRTPFDMDSSSTDFINVIDRGGNADEFIDSVTNTGANPTISHSRLTKLISKMSRHSTPLLLLVIILLLSVVVSLLARLNHSSKSAISMVALPQTETNARTVSFRDLVPLMSSTTQQTPSDITNSPIKLFIGNNSGGLYAGIPASLANSSVQLLFVEQVTRGVGIRDLWYDAGKIVSQELVYFSLSDEPSSGTSSSATTTAPRKLILTAVNPQHIETCSAAITLQQQCIDVNNFASSVVWSFDVLDISTDTEDTLYLISLQELALSKAGLGHSTDLSDAIRGLYGPNYQFLIDSSRSHVVYSKCRSNNHVSFFESNLTYVYNNNPSQGIAALPADMESALTSPGAITIALRRNFIVLPSLDTNTKSTASRTYHRRRYHPKSGFNSITIMNESATPLQARDKHFMIRFGLTTAATPPVAKQPQLLYLVDPQAPSDIQLALIDGINWWDEAFQYAGFPPGTIEARLASPDDDPYSMEVVGVVYVRWVHRNLRSYSMGLRVIDPRTGQILHGHVLIGSLRMRQDVLLAEALLPHWQLGTQQNDILAAIIQRHRQLGAHEVGHTLGLAHNFAGSSVGYGDSVMDYPPPLVTLNASGDGLILNQQAYASGIGQLDKLAISFGYKVFEFSEDIVGGYNEAQDFQMLSSAINAAESQLGYVYLTDQDSGVGDEDWRSSAWDNGNDPCTELANALAVRSIALAQFNDSSLLASDPDSKLRELFPLVYLWHRYEVAAAGKLLGGASFAYTLRGDRLHHRVTPISGQWQRRALQQLLAAVKPSALAISPSIALLLLPPAFGYTPAVGGIPDLLPSRTGSQFDVVSAMEVGAELVYSTLFSLPRIERLAVQKLWDNTLPDLLEVLVNCTETLIVSVLSSDLTSNVIDEHLFAIMAAQTGLINHYIDLVTSQSASTMVVGQVSMHLSWLLPWLQSCLNAVGMNLYWFAHLKNLVNMITSKTVSTSFANGGLVNFPLGPPI